MTSKKKPNIIFITFDSVRPDHLSYLGYKKNTSPFLDSLVKKGTYFTRAFATGPGSPDSFVAIFSSTYPFDYGGFEYIDRPRILLSEVLQSAGYRTIGIHSAAYLSSYFGYNRGWDKFVYLSSFADSGVMPGIRQDTWQSRILKKLSAIHRFLKQRYSVMDKIFSVIERVLFVLRKVFLDLFRFRPAFIIAEGVNEEVKRALPRKPKEPLFLWVHFMDPHGPYALFWKIKGNIRQKMKYFICDITPFIFGPRSFITRLFKSFFIDAYDSSIRYTDRNIGDLFKYLSSIGVINDDSLVVLCSDHGEEFFDNGSIGHMDLLYNVNINVPLIFYGSKHLPETNAIERPVSLIDISPTILNVAGVTKPKVFRGRSVFDAEKRPVISQASDVEADLSNQRPLGASIIYDGYKFIKLAEKKMLFSMTDDFAERRNLYDEQPEIARRLEEMIKPHVAHSPK